MRKSMFAEKINLKREQEQQIRREIKAFYLDVRGEDLGIIEEQQLFDLFLEHMAPIIYNKTLDDARLWHRQQLEAMESDYYLLYCD